MGLDTMRKGVRRFLRRNMPYVVLITLTISILAVFFYPRIFVTIHSGQAGVLYQRFSGGTVTEYVFPEGFYFIAPWNSMAVYNVRNQIAPHTFDVLTKKGLAVSITMNIRYRPDYDLLGLLHQKVGPDYLNVVIKPELENTMRSILGGYDINQIYESHHVIVRQLVNESLDQINQLYVHVDDVLITQVVFPEQLREAISKKMVKEQEYLSYAFILKGEEEERKRKIIEAEGIREYQEIVNKSITPEVLTLKGINATEAIAQSDNAKVVVIGSGKDGLPIILGGNQ